jgi:hypothetical protein
MLLDHRAAQAQAQSHAFGLGGEERREQLLRHLGSGMPGPGRPPRIPASPWHCVRWCPHGAPGSAPARSAVPAASMACMALRARFSSTCSTMVRSHSTAGRPSCQPCFHPHAQLARLQAHQRHDGVEQRARRHRLARLVAPAHEVVHALDDLAGALSLLGDAAHRHFEVGHGMGAVLAAGSSNRWRSWQIAASGWFSSWLSSDAISPTVARRAVACSRSWLARDSSSTRRCSLMSRNALIQPVCTPWH